MSLFVIYFGLKKNHRQLAHHTVCFGPRYKGLLDDIFNGPSLATDFSLYLHAPSVTDPSLAPEGCGSYYVLAPVPHLGTANIDWAAEGPKYRDRILSISRSATSRTCGATSSRCGTSRPSTSATISTAISARPSRSSRS
jgi:phytoene dehydrogenase-like protein